MEEVTAARKLNVDHFAGAFALAARAAELAGDTVKARTYYGRLVILGEGADADRSELKQAKRFIARK